MSDNNNKPAKRTTRLTSTNETEYYKLDTASKPVRVGSVYEEEFMTTNLLKEFESIFQNHKDYNARINKLRILFEEKFQAVKSEFETEKIDYFQLIEHKDTIIKEREETIDQFKITNTNIQEAIIEKDQVISELNSKINKIKTMVNNITLKDIIIAIPIFSGDLAKFDTFINTCEVYNDLVENDLKETLLKIVKTKIVGEALHKVGDVSTINTWANLKKRLNERIRRPNTYEYASADISSVFQAVNESIEEYGNRVKEKLRNLNEASKSIIRDNNDLTPLRTANEKLAITKFIQNLRNESTRILISAQAKDNLDDCIALALQKEMLEKSSNLKKCDFCFSNKHESAMCFKNPNKRNQQNKNFPKRNFNNSFKFKNQNNNGNEGNPNNSFGNFNANNNNNFDSTRPNNNPQPGPSNENKSNQNKFGQNRSYYASNPNNNNNNNHQNHNNNNNHQNQNTNNNYRNVRMIDSGNDDGLVALSELLKIESENDQKNVNPQDL